MRTQKATRPAQLVFPLDVPNVDQAYQLVKQLSHTVDMFKVGLELFTAEGPDIVRRIQQLTRAQIFLDLKLHDIPATVHRTMRRIAQLGVAMTTVHCGETAEMLQAAVSGADSKVKVLAITVLTSVSPAELEDAGFKDTWSQNLSSLVLKRAATAQQAGCDGVVCSGQEVAAVKKTLGASFLAVTPGIRPAAEKASSDDQRRVVTPADAVRWGSDYVVVGRPIRDAKDPAAAAAAILEEIKGAA